VELHCARSGNRSAARHLNDIDFVVRGFDSIPKTLARDFLFRHVHPFDPPGKTVLQLVDPDTSLRVDVFRAYGAILSRTLRMDFPSGSIRVISAEDVLARTARILLDLGEGVPVPAKHAGDYVRLAQWVPACRMETAWQDHRKQGHPLTFHETHSLVSGLLAARRDLLITPEYSKDVRQICPRCVPATAFPLADPKVVLALLGYC